MGRLAAYLDSQIAVQSKTPSMTKMLAQRTNHARPAIVYAAVIAIVGCAAINQIPTQLLFPLSNSSQVAWYFEAYHPAANAIAPLLILLALCAYYGIAWSRYATLTLACVELGLKWGLGYNLQSGNFSLAALREIVVPALLVLAVILLFMPSASQWFLRHTSKSAA